MRPSHPRQRSKSVTILLPAKDEAEAIGSTMRSIPTDTLEAMGLDVEVLVLDGQSSDATREIVYDHGGATVVFDEGRGKARAVRNGRRHVHGDHVVMLDADGTYAVDAIPRVLAPLIHDDADVVMGHRRPLPGAMSGTHRFGNAVLTLVACTLYLSRCPDLCTGLWGFQADAFHALPLRSRAFELEADMYACASRMDLRIEHAPVDYLPRLGASKLDAWDGLRILWWLLRSRMTPLETHGSARRVDRSLDASVEG